MGQFTIIGPAHLRGRGQNVYDDFTWRTIGLAWMFIMKRLSAGPAGMDKTTTCWASE